MRTTTLGQLTVSAQGLGCMGMSEWYGATDWDESIATIHRALDLGVTFIDTADIYGAGHNEVLVGRGIAGSEQEHRSRLFFTQVFQHCPAVNDRQHDIEDDRIVAVVLGLEQTLLAIAGGIDGVALFAQRLSQAAEQTRLVLNNQNSHGGGCRQNITIGR